LTHGHKVNFSGKLYNFVHYGLNDKGYVDMEEVERLAKEYKPKMIVTGFSAYSRNLDWQAFRRIANDIGAILFADISHIAGLVAAEVIENPIPICDVVSSTTHKTLRGPRGAIIMCKERFAKAIDKAVFPGTQGGPHNNMTAAKAVAFKEALSDDFKIYAKQVISNAQSLAREFLNLGYNIVSGGTDNHMFILDLSPKNMAGKEAEKALEYVGISVSRSTIPNDSRPPFNPSGLRLGTPAITTRGMKEEDMKQLAKLINETIINFDNKDRLNSIKEEVKKKAQSFPLKY
jgi:glycine hydroxymethyltransferase